MRTTMARQDLAVLLDLDGTLVDSVYHHVLAWDATFTAAGYEVALARIHAAIGMGAQRLIPWLLGHHPPDVETLADEHTRRFLEVADRLRATDGAAALIEDLERRKVPFRIATSADREVCDALLATLGRSDLAAVNADGVGAGKPAPDLLLAACDDLGVAPGQALLVGDSPWDAAAARRVGLPMVGVGCGGFALHTLRQAGAWDAVANPRELIGRL